MEPTLGNDNNVNMPPLERRKTRRLKPAGWAIIIVLFLLCGWLGFWLAQSFMDPLVPRDKQGEFQAAGTNSSDILNILLLGVDQRENEPARSDTIIVASLNLKEKKIHLLSIPRDTRVDIPGKGTTKINAANAVGGQELAVKTVEKFLGIPIHYYIETNFQGFEHIIDILGGITINVEERMYLPLEGIDLKAGLQKLKGHDALSYVRWRGDGMGDIGRISRQQKFFKALADQSMQFSTIWKLPELLEELNKQVKTDLNVQKMIALGNKFRDIKNIKLETDMVPGVPEDINGGSYWIPDTKALQKIISDIYGKSESGDQSTTKAKD